MSLTCRSMLQLCRKHLLYEINIEPRSTNDLNYTARPFMSKYLKQNSSVFRVKTVERLVESTPDILKNVRRLILESHQFNYNDAALIVLLSKFDNLTSFSIAAHESADGGRFVSGFFQPNHSWNSLPQSYQLALVKLMHRSPLRELAFDNYGDIPLDILLPFGSLVNLSLSRTTFSSSNPVLPSTSISNRPTRPLQLKELRTKYHITDIAPLLNQESVYGHPIIDPAALKSLNMELKNADATAWDRNMLKDISNLECLFISNPCSYFEFYYR